MTDVYLSSMTTAQTKTFKIAHNRGKPRVWIEGKFLLDSGIHRGMKFDKIFLDVDYLDPKDPEQNMLLSFSLNGKHTVAGTAARPIIDLNGNYLNQIFKDCTHYTAEITERKGFEDNSISIWIEGVNKNAN